MTLPPPAAPASTSTGLAPNVAGALTYALGIITGIAFLVLEKENRFVRYHAAHSIGVSIVVIVLSIILSVLSAVVSVVPVLGWIVAILLSLLLGLGTFVLWLLLMWQAYQGKEWSLPVAGQIARKIVP